MMMYGENIFLTNCIETSVIWTGQCITTLLQRYEVFIHRSTTSIHPQLSALHMTD
jgi:hypothetical protein